MSPLRWVWMGLVVLAWPATGCRSEQADAMQECERRPPLGQPAPPGSVAVDHVAERSWRVMTVPRVGGNSRGRDLYVAMDVDDGRQVYFQAIYLPSFEKRTADLASLNAGVKVARGELWDRSRIGATFPAPSASAPPAKSSSDPPPAMPPKDQVLIVRELQATPGGSPRHFDVETIAAANCSRGPGWVQGDATHVFWAACGVIGIPHVPGMPAIKTSRQLDEMVVDDAGVYGFGSERYDPMCVVRWDKDIEHGSSCIQKESRSPLVADQTHLFFTRNEPGGKAAIVSIPKAGGEPKVLHTSDQRIQSLTQGGGRLYWIVWSEPGGSDRIMTMPVAGGEPKELVSQPSLRMAMAEGEGLYWVHRGKTVYRMDGAAGEARALATIAEYGATMAIGREHVFLSTNEGTVWRIPRAGGEPTLIHKGPSELKVVYADNRYVYWVEPLPEMGDVLLLRRKGS